MVTIVPDVVQRQTVASLRSTDTVRDAVTLMVERRIGAVTIVDDKSLVGIFSERDALVRVLAEDLNPDETPLSKVMTPDPDTMGPDDSPSDVLERMTERGYRHVPIVEDGRLVAIVSLRDLYKSVTATLNDDLNRSQEFMFGTGYGG